MRSIKLMIATAVAAAVVLIGIGAAATSPASTGKTDTATHATPKDWWGGLW